MSNGTPALTGASGRIRVVPLSGGPRAPCQPRHRWSGAAGSISGQPAQGAAGTLAGLTEFVDAQKPTNQGAGTTRTASSSDAGKT